ncbi:hypothetical protein PAS25_24210 [Leclercia adecarboxylata]|uniref:hypothetical protein n=1 Tax=Leclercia adecarboxylata TaxID=83655 RepID=UPI00111AAE0B|nr:hypothetical protein [Leclercia adecarboxylata]QCZ29251.1 hypothetical protein FHN83_22555 [Leclercia adecarboxylata]
MATCPNCFRTITNNHCPDCEEIERSKTRHGSSSSYMSTYTPPPPSTPYSSGYSGGTGYGGKKLPATTGEIIFNVIAAIVIISICLFVAYQVMISA